MMSTDKHYLFIEIAEKIYPDKEQCESIVHLLINKFSSLKDAPDSIKDRFLNEHGVNIKDVCEVRMRFEYRFSSLINASMKDIQLIFGKELYPLVNQIRNEIYE
jgi:hypothetical protein